MPLKETLTNYSSWSKMVNIMGWLLRFAHNLQKTCSQLPKKTEPYLTNSEREEAAERVIHMAQTEFFSLEIESLQKGEDIPTSSSLLQLQPFLDEKQILRVGGRLRKAPVSIEARHQVILHAKDWIAKPLITNYHKLCIDEGLELLLSALRQKFWIIGGRPLAKRIIKDCMTCKRRKVKPVNPRMADLPKARVAIGCPVFFNSGVDFFGPLQVKIRRSIVKRWGCIFTCLTTRAVHLEVAEGLDADTFINCLRRFVNRRGTPKMIMSDCGTNFKGADEELKRALRELDNNRIGELSAERNIKWQYNPPEAPHMGGAWERLVRCVKGPLKLMLKNHAVTDFQLLTIFTEAENIVNSRPLTAVSDDVNDYEALTPNHFLIGRPNANLPIMLPCDTSLFGRKRWKQTQALTEHFWRRFTKEYLPLLTIRTKWHKEQRNIEVGDLVLVIDKDMPRGKWKLGRIQETYPGDDGHVRAVQVKTPTGVYTRPVVKLCLLEEAQK